MNNPSDVEIKGLDRAQINHNILHCSQRYRSLIEACLSRLLALPVGQAIYALDCLCDRPDATVAARLHAVDLAVETRVQMPLVMTSITGTNDVINALQSLKKMVPAKDQEDFWLALAVAWIQVVPRRSQYLDDPFHNRARVLESDEQFRRYLRSELMNRLAALF